MTPCNSGKLSALEISVDSSAPGAKIPVEVFASGSVSFSDVNFVELAFRCENAIIQLHLTGAGWKGFWACRVASMLSTPYSYQRGGHYAIDPENGWKMHPVAPLEDNKDYRIVCGLGGARLHIPQGAMRISLKIAPREEGELAKVTLSHIRFFRAPEKYDSLCREYDEYIKNYKPDYSKSSKYLLPPEHNRFKGHSLSLKTGIPPLKLFIIKRKPPFLKPPPRN